MRTIKFRGKDVNTGEWLYWQFGDGNGDTFYNKVIPETVCQFVMRHKGNDIYEHDLILFCGLLCEVVYVSERCCFLLLYNKRQNKVMFSIGEGFRLYDYELKGTIFDNK